MGGRAMLSLGTQVPEDHVGTQPAEARPDQPHCLVGPRAQGGREPQVPRSAQTRLGVAQDLQCHLTGNRHTYQRTYKIFKFTKALTGP